MVDQHNAEVATLAVRVAGLEDQFRTFMATMTAKLDHMSRTNWPLIVGFLGVGWGFYTNIDQTKLAPLQSRDQEVILMIKEIQSEMKANVVPVWVHDIERKYRDTQITAITDRAKIIEENASQRIKRIEDMIGSTYNIRDALTLFQQRIDRLEQDTWRASVEPQKGS